MTNPANPNRLSESLFLDDDALDVACPGCNADLTNADLYQQLRVCPQCGRHFWLPARERIALIADADSFNESAADPLSLDPELVHDRLPVADRLAEARELPAIAEAVVTGVATIGGEMAVVVAIDLAYLGASLGIVAGEKITLAMELALSRRLPILIICSGGGASGPEGVLGLAQMRKLAITAARLHRASVPVISLLTHPTLGTTLIGLGLQADLVFAEPGAQIGFGGREAGSKAHVTAERFLAAGEIDGIIERGRQREQLALLIDILQRRGSARSAPATEVAAATGLSPWEETAILRHVSRPTAASYLHRLSPQSIWLHGDHTGDDDPATLIGFGRIDGAAAALVAIGGRVDGAPLLPSAAAFRKARRLILLAAHLELPVVVLVDSIAISPSSAAAASEVARYLRTVASAPTPIIAVVAGEVGGSAGFALTVADRVLMQRYAALAPATSDVPANARDCLRLGVSDEIVAEPEAGAQSDPDLAAHLLGHRVAIALADLLSLGTRRLLDERTRRASAIGLNTPAGREAARRELTELTEVQRRLRESIDDLRRKLERRQIARPSLPGNGLPAISLPQVKFRREAIGEFASRVAASSRARMNRDQPATPGESDES